MRKGDADEAESKASKKRQPFGSGVAFQMDSSTQNDFAMCVESSLSIVLRNRMDDYQRMVVCSIWRGYVF